MNETIDQQEKHRKLKVAAVRLGLVAFAVYIGFITIGALRG